MVRLTAGSWHRLAGFLLCSSAVRVHDSQACGKMDVTRERISRILELRNLLLSFKTGFNPSFMLLSPLLSWRVFQAWNPRHIQLGAGN